MELLELSQLLKFTPTFKLKPTFSKLLNHKQAKSPIDRTFAVVVISKSTRRG